MADEKVNVSPEEKKAPEAPAPSGLGSPPALKRAEGPCCPLVRIRGLPPMLSLLRSLRERAPDSCFPGMKENSTVCQGVSRRNIQTVAHRTE